MTGGGTTTGGRRSPIDWDVQPFGRMTDEEIARSLCVTRQAVGLQRRRRGIPPGGAPLLGRVTKLELEVLASLERGLASILDPEREQLSIASAMAVGQTQGWRAEVRHARASVSRATAFRFRAPGRRRFTEWLAPRASRVWLLASGWADQAQRAADELRRLRDQVAEQGGM